MVRKKTARISKHLLACMAIVLAGFALRVWRLDAQALSGDEAFSILNWTRGSISYLFGTVAIVDPQPPATLLSLYLWVRMVGDTEFAARMLSVLAGTITIASTFTLGRQLTGIRGALLASLLIALNPFHIWYAQDVRSYSLWIAASTLSLALLVRSFCRPNDSRTRLIYILAASLAAYTFYLEVFMLIAHNFYALAHLLKQRSRQRLFSWIKTQLGLAALIAPWYIYIALPGRSYRPTAGDAEPLLALRTFLFGATIPATALAGFSLATLLTAFTCLIFAASLLILWHTRPRSTLVLLLSSSLLPIVLLSLLAITTGHGYFHPRYVAASSVPMVIAITALLSHRSKSLAFRSARVFGIAVFLSACAVSLIHYRYDPHFAKAPPWREIVALLVAQGQPSDLVLRNYPDPAFDYYYRGPADTRVLPRSQNGPADETLTDLNVLSEQYTYIWFLPVESRIYDRDAIVSTWLEQNLPLISEQWVGPTRIKQYASPSYLVPEISLDTPVNYADTVLLLGYRTTPPLSALKQGTTINLELFWQPVAQSDESYKIFLHLLGPQHDDTLLWAQDDQLPGDGRLSSVDWPLNQVFRDVYQLTIPESAPSGVYYLTVGLYSETTGSRLPPLNADVSPEPEAAIILKFTLP
jgi:4-amino-4-deoxy-L-arabinose transferase-like glycosyltransferase